MRKKEQTVNFIQIYSKIDKNFKIPLKIFKKFKSLRITSKILLFLNNLIIDYGWSVVILGILILSAEFIIMFMISIYSLYQLAKNKIKER